MDYSHMTAAELRNIAKEKGIKKTSSMKKQELLEALEMLEKEAVALVLESVSKEETAETEAETVTSSAKSTTMQIPDQYLQQAKTPVKVRVW